MSILTTGLKWTFHVGEVKNKITPPFELLKNAVISHKAVCIMCKLWGNKSKRKNLSDKDDVSSKGMVY